MIDLIDECGEDLTANGYKCIKLDRYSMISCELSVKSVGKAKKYGFHKGDYFVLNAPHLSLLMVEHKPHLKRWLYEKMKRVFAHANIKKSSKILIVGIGNPAIAADSFGVRVVQKIKIEPFKRRNRLFKIIPNTFSNTGINALDIIKHVVNFLNISAVVLFDSLATQSLARLGCSIQVNNAGLTPGSATNNFGKPISKATLGVPCIAVGVPMMILARALGQKSDVIFAEKDIEEKVEFLSKLTAEVLDEFL